MLFYTGTGKSWFIVRICLIKIALRKCNVPYKKGTSCMDFFWSNGLNLNKLGRYPPGDVAYIEALDLVFSNNKVL